MIFCLKVVGTGSLPCSTLFFIFDTHTHTTMFMYIYKHKDTPTPIKYIIATIIRDWFPFLIVKMKLVVPKELTGWCLFHKRI